MRNFIHGSWAVVGLIALAGCGSGSPAGSSSSGTSGASGSTGTSTTGSTGTIGSGGNTTTGSSGTTSSGSGGSSGSTSGSSTGTGGSTGSAITGQVALAGLGAGLDPSGVSVALSYADGGAIQQTATDDAGFYSVGPVPDGVYGLRFIQVIDAGSLGQIPYQAWLPEVSWVDGGATVDDVLGVTFDQPLASPLLLGAGTQFVTSNPASCAGIEQSVLDGGALLYVAHGDGGTSLGLLSETGSAVPLVSGLYGNVLAVGGPTLAAMHCDASTGTQCTINTVPLGDPAGAIQSSAPNPYGYGALVSGDGSEVAFFSNCIQNAWFANCDLNLLPVNAGVAAHDTGQSVPMGPAVTFSSDGRFLAYVTGSGNNSVAAGTLHLLEMDGGAIYAQPMSVADYVYFGDNLTIGEQPPRFSPDGHYLAYVWDNNFSFLRVIDTNKAWDSGDAGSGYGWEGDQFDFSPDSKWIAFEDFRYRTLFFARSGAATDTQLNAAMPMNTNNSPFDPYKATPFVFSPDSAPLAFAPSDAGLQLASLYDDGGYVSTTLEPDVADNFLFSPDGRVIAADVQKYGFGYPDILEVVKVSGGTPVEVSSALDPATPEQMTFSSDSSHLAYVEGGGSNGDSPGPLFLADLDGGRSQVASAVFPYGDNFAFSEDGRALVFVETFDGGSSSMLEAVSTEGGEPLPLNAGVHGKLVITHSGVAAARCMSPTSYDYGNGIYVTPMP